MFDSNNLFSDPAIDPCRVITHVLNIYVSQWSTFLAISLMQAVSLFMTILISSIIVGSFFLFVFIRRTVDDGGVTAGVFIPLVLLFFASTIAVGWVWCIFAGAMVRATVETCAGGSPSACNTVSIASKRACSMIGFQILFGFIICGGGLILSRLVAANSDDDDDDDFYSASLDQEGAGLFAGEFSSTWSSIIPSQPYLYTSTATNLAICLLYALFVFIANTSMIGATPIIVVEHKSSCAALRRSWNLCKHSICLIFLSVAVVNLLSVSAYIMLWVLVGQLSIILFAVTLVLFIIAYPLTMITSAVLYLSLRAASESLTCSELSDALLLTHPEQNAPLATINEDITDEEEDDKKTPLLQAELVSEIV